MSNAMSPSDGGHEPQSPSPLRPRASKAACSTCHQRKVKCDAQVVGFPCSSCRKHQRSDCVWHQKRRRVTARPAHPQDPVPIRQALPIDVEHWSGDVEVPSHSAGHVQTRSAETARASGYALAEDGTKRHLVEFIDQEGLGDRPIDNEARISYVGTDISNINFLVRQTDQQLIVYHFTTNRIDRRFTAHEPDRIPAEVFELPEKMIVDELLRAYFKKINPGFPVIDEDRFLKQYHARDPTDPPSLLLLHAILMVGAHVTEAYKDLKATFFRRAKILIDSRFERNRDVVVQAALLLTWHSDGPEDVAANAWHWIGVAARLALGLGMHRNAEPSTLVEHNKKMWRRVWWLLVQCDLLIALQYGRPLAINLDDADVLPPKPSDYDSCGPTVEVSYAIALTDLCIILRDIYRKFFGPHSSSSNRNSTLVEADNALARWSLMLPHSLRLQPTSTLELWPSTLHLVYNTALVLFHRPRPHPATPSSPSSLPGANDAEICSAAAGTIQAIFESLAESNALPSLWVFSLTSLFTAMIQLSAEVRFSNPLLAIAAVRRYDSTLYSLRTLAKYWPNAESILHFFEHSQRLQKNNVHTQAPPLISPQPLASPPSVREPPAEDGPQDVNEEHIAKDWRQLFPFTETIGTERAVHGSEFLENWQGMYWDEPWDLWEEVRMN
ncbi:hypothetical protein P154DRAFT_619254 [Amniculicola lignicola CBS 123094]|uniref:Zn(2)-C6 fungal-type domain-containing protein n=1 Tax=Amniculicola lignicola CBS 123094 TaxID=1392246 RepID=A0A6A5WI56_9PLEO|nr:hypothetical protein P154DRAFT_619254 [Amniculicola lignicola CBS 123094]